PGDFGQLLEVSGLIGLGECGGLAAAPVVVAVMAAMPVTAATTVPGAYVGHHQAQHNQHQANLREQFHNVSLSRDNGRSPHSRNMRSKENMGGLGKMFIWGGIEGIHVKRNQELANSCMTSCCTTSVLAMPLVSRMTAPLMASAA